MDEPHPEGGGADKRGWRQVYEVTRNIRPRKHGECTALSMKNRGLIFWQIKYLRVPDEIVEVVKEQQAKDQASRGGRGNMHQRGEHRGDRGGRGMRGRGRGRGRGGSGGA